MVMEVKQSLKEKFNQLKELTQCGRIHTNGVEGAKEYNTKP